MSTNAEEAVRYFSTGCNCAQAVFASFGPRCGIAERDALRIATGFGAGMARMQEVCGAVTGAIMVIGCAHGMTESGDAGAKEETYRQVQELSQAFRENHGTLRCKELLGCDLGTVEGRTYFEDHDLHRVKCTGYVREASDIVDTLLRRDPGTTTPR